MQIQARMEGSIRTDTVLSRVVGLSHYIMHQRRISLLLLLIVLNLILYLYDRKWKALKFEHDGSFLLELPAFSKLYDIIGMSVWNLAKSKPVWH